MASSVSTCIRCGQRIVGAKHVYGGKAYCEACYKALMDELAKTESQKADLYKYICNLFGKQECPEVVVYGVDKLLASGYKISGIKATVWWWYEIEGHSPDNINFIIKVVTEQYKNAREYVIKQKEINAANDQIDLHNVPTQHITINSKKNSRTWKPNYRMEDL